MSCKQNSSGASIYYYLFVFAKICRPKKKNVFINIKFIYKWQVFVYCEQSRKFGFWRKWYKNLRNCLISFSRACEKTKSSQRNYYNGIGWILIVKIITIIIKILWYIITYSLLLINKNSLIWVRYFIPW